MSRTHSLVAGLILASACSSSDAHEESRGASPVVAAPASAPLAPAAAPAKASPAEASEDVPGGAYEGGARAFAKVRETLLQNYYAEGITEDDLYRAATAGMLEKLDPKMTKWNKLIGPQELAEMKSDLRGEIVGIGVQIQFDEPSGYADVLATIPGSPSEKAGLRSGDKIVTVNGKLYKGMRLRDVVADIRGSAGEAVTLSVLRADKLLGFTIKRERVGYDQPEAFVLPDGVGYVRIPSFTDKTPGVVRSLLEDLEKKSARSLIVDLRRCPGGSFERALDTADLLLAEGTPVVTLKRRNKAEERSVARGGSVLGAVPVAVLVNQGTASGCEILASALRDGRHARLVGQKTLGKWSVQSLDELSNGYAFKYTVSLFKTPAGKTFEGIGMTPDVEVALDEASFGRAGIAATLDDRLALDVQLRTARELLTK